MGIDIRGKWALVTGASRGIGSLVSVALAERHCNLVLHSRSTAHSEQRLEGGPSEGSTGRPRFGGL